MRMFWKNKILRLLVILMAPIVVLSIAYLFSGVNILGFLILLLSYVRMTLSFVGIDIGLSIANTDDIKTAPGFTIEEVYSVPNLQGSWVSLTADDKGNLYAADQISRGIFKISPSKIGDGSLGTVVSEIDAPLLSAQGLLWFDDALYASHNGKDSGVWKITDSNLDGVFNHQEKIFYAGYDGEHGLHGLAIDRSGENIYLSVGNMIEIPETISQYRVPPIWKNDTLSSVMLDPSGLFDEVKIPGGWIAKISIKGEAASGSKQYTSEIFSVGFRNAYDLAISQQGEIFTYDADMEWDIGLPWYRPTRINHVVSGADFGWRNGSGKWPEYYADSLPPVLNIGPGSPTGVLFAYGASFPKKWHDTLFLLDWTYGTIWAAQLSENGASYTSELEPFVTAGSLPVTDAAIGKDGAFYFVVGGRAMPSKLYRVVYSGGEEIGKSVAVSENEYQNIRRKLELLHKNDVEKSQQVLDFIWPYLAHEDRFIRHAARIALEKQRLGDWQQRLLDESKPSLVVNAAIALARQGDNNYFESLVRQLLNLNIPLEQEQLYLDWIRALSLSFLRLSDTASAQATQNAVLQVLDPIFPSTSKSINRELLSLLVYLDSNKIVKKAIEEIGKRQLEDKPDWKSAEVLSQSFSFFGDYGGTAKAVMDNMPPVQDLHYAYALREAHSGWTQDLRKQYFEFISQAAQFPGGSSYISFLETIREQALSNTSKENRKALADIINVSLERKLDFQVKSPEGPGRNWTTEGAVAIYKQQGLKESNFSGGRNMFYAVGCGGCHQFNGSGGAVGPDLSTVANKFSVEYLLESIVEPSKAVSSQYESASAMPPMLINSLSERELLDLLAYLMSKGNEEHEFFRK